MESGGANLMYQADDLVEGGRSFANQARLSAAGIPQIAVVHGSSTAGGAYLPGLSWDATLLACAVGRAVHSTLPAGRACTTAELSVKLVCSAVAGREPLRAVGQAIHVGRQLATAEGRIVDAAGRVYADATTCLVFELPPARRGCGGAGWT